MSNIEVIEIAELLERAEMEGRKDAGRETDERWAFVCELHRRGGREVYEAALKWCDSSEVALRCLGADVLGQLGYKEGYPFASESATLLLRLLSDNESPVIECSLIALGHLRLGSLEAICALAGHESAAVRHAVAFSIGARDEGIGAQTLMTLSSDSDAGVRDWATFGLGTLSNIDTPALRDALAARLNDDDSEVRGEAVRGLATRQDVRALPAILAELNQPDVSIAAIDAASEMPNDAFLEPLEALLEQNPTAEDIQLALDRCRKAATA